VEIVLGPFGVCETAIRGLEVETSSRYARDMVGVCTTTVREKQPSAVSDDIAADTALAIVQGHAYYFVDGARLGQSGSAEYIGVILAAMGSAQNTRCRGIFLYFKTLISLPATDRDGP
jgi:hypothetical protein